MLSFANLGYFCPNDYLLQTEHGAADETWTRTVSLPRDFKSLVSAYSTTAAYLIKYKAVHLTPFTTAAFLLPIYTSGI